jgi:uncharacterized protein (DUF2235 family)
LAKRTSMLKGLAFGDGFMQNIEDAYRFLMTTYEPGDQVYLFGFSRGAFTVRALAGMLYSVGLLYPGTENLIRYAQSYWQKDFRPNSVGADVCSEFKATLARPCPVHFIGVWDTVSSVGFVNQWKVFPFTAHNPEVSHVRHAVSIDERRCFFRQNLMFKANDSQDVKNVWFAGVHSDVGGGYPPDEAGLAKITFDWMMREAKACSLQINDNAFQHELRGVGAPPDACANQHNQLKGWWRLAELIPMRHYNWTTGRYGCRIPLGRPRDVECNATKPEVLMHQSVIDRLSGRSDYRPENIPHTETLVRALFKIET